MKRVSRKLYPNSWQVRELRIHQEEIKRKKEEERVMKEKEEREIK